MPELLVELFSEEIPARMQRKAAEDLKKAVTNALVDAGLVIRHVNPAAENLFEVSSRQLLGHPLHRRKPRSLPVRVRKK